MLSVVKKAVSMSCFVIGVVGCQKSQPAAEVGDAAAVVPAQEAPAQPAAEVAAPAADAAAAAAAPAPAGDAAAAAPAARVSITVADDGFHPAEVNGKVGQALTIVFTRTGKQGCGERVSFPSLQMEKDLPLDTAVEVTVTPAAAGRLEFTCGMNMMRGAVIAE